METYRKKSVGRRKGDVVQAIQVKQPYRDITNVFPRSHKKKKPSGALDYIHIVDAPQDSNAAAEGDWIVKFPDGSISVLKDAEFQSEYGVGA